MAGAGGKSAADENGFSDITYMPCLPENNFFPDLSAVKKESLIYICSPNNPTGAVATKKNLETLVEFAKKNECIILFDGAYSAFIQDENLPKTIYEIDGAADCAIEMQSFSKPAGFTGVRLGWCVVPENLKFDDGSSVASAFARITNTAFNGASNIAQAGGFAALDEKGLAEMQGTIKYYLENAALIRDALSGENFKRMGVEVYSGGNAPYVWAKFPGKKSWDVFDAILKKCCVVVTPGAGFGPSGESFIRFSSFGHRENVQEACRRLSSFEM
jgi:LL-diaminopimelate aminotransferase